MQDGINPTVKRKKPAFRRFSGCFSPRFHSFEISASSSSNSSSGSPKWSPSSWFHSKPPHDNNSLDLKQLGKNRQFTPRIGRIGRRHSADFSYDPRSYALNFDDGKYPESHKFSSRLPQSPPRRSNDVVSTVNPPRPASTVRSSPETWISSVKRTSADSAAEEGAVTARNVVNVNVNEPPLLALQILV